MDVSTALSATQQMSPKQYFKQASDLAHECIRESGDDPPHLGVLQSLVLITAHEMFHAARGKAWRSLGACIRLAFELGLHKIDAAAMHRLGVGSTTAMMAESWIMEEERRRTWWAIWEFDVFISTVNKLPVSITDGHNATLLPVDDESWFEGEQRESSFLDADPVKRWKCLQTSGNLSGKAWFIVINSLTRDVHAISHPTLPVSQSKSDLNSKMSVTATKVNTLSNCVSCFVLALPAELSYERFSAAENVDWITRRKVSEKQLIHVMVQLTKLYINHHHCFNRGSQLVGSLFSRILESPMGPGSHGGTKCSESDNQSKLAWSEYLEAAGEIVQVVRGSHVDHVRYGHPLLANTYWIAATIQLLNKVLSTTEEERQLAQSNFELLNLTLIRHQKFWSASSTPLTNLNLLNLRLDPLAVRQHYAGSSTEQTLPNSKVGSERPPDQDFDGMDFDRNQSTQERHQEGAVESGLLDGHTVGLGQHCPDLENNVVNEITGVGGRIDAWSGDIMDDNGLQAYIDTIFSNQWDNWDQTWIGESGFNPLPHHDVA